MQKMEDMAKEVADTIRQYSHVRIISHNDADGISSAAIICQALLRAGITYQASIRPMLDKDVIETVNNSTMPGDLVMFCDMGSGYPDLISQVTEDVVIIDHHKPAGQAPAKAVVNPHLAGIEGAIDLCAGCTTYLVAEQLDSRNIDLAGLAIAGAVGDKQLFEQGNKLILDRAVKAGVVSIRKGLKVGDGDIARILATNPEPYLDITGDEAAISQFLSSLNISGNVEDLSPEALKKLSSAIVVKLAKNASPEAVDATLGDVYILNKELIKNVYDMVTLMNTCGKEEKGDMALSICLGDETFLQEANQLVLENQKKIVSDIKKALGLLKEGKYIWYINASDMESTGMIASTVIRYMHPEKPFVAVNQVEELVKVSARGTRALVERGLDLCEALRIAAGEAGGNGGGHNIASGASIPPGTADAFIKRVDGIVGEQLG